MPTFTAGQELRASDLADALMIVAYATSDTTRTSSTTMLDAAGMALNLEAGEVYGWDCYLAYSASETADFRVAMTYSGTSPAAHFGVYGGSTGVSAGIGSATAVRTAAIGSGNFIALGGNNTPSAPGPMAALVRGYIETTTAGVLQLQFAQNTSNATGSIVRAGSWIRAFKLA